VAQVTVDRGDQTTTVLWSRVPSPQKVTLGARAGSALVVDTRTGSAWTQGASGGAYTLSLPGSTCTQPVGGACPVGGWPILVVEQGGGGVGQPVPQTPRPSVTVSALAPGRSTGASQTEVTATPRPSSTAMPTPTSSPTQAPTDTPTATAVPTRTPTLTRRRPNSSTTPDVDADA
jgi:hypothetical protein